MNKIIQELDLPGAITRPIAIKRKKSICSQVEIQLELDILKDVDSESAKKTV